MRDQGNQSNTLVIPSSEYFIGFSSLPTTKSWLNRDEKSCGFYFKAIVEVFKDAFWRLPIEESKR